MDWWVAANAPFETRRYKSASLHRKRTNSKFAVHRILNLGNAPNRSRRDRLQQMLGGEDHETCFCTCWPRRAWRGCTLQRGRVCDACRRSDSRRKSSSPAGYVCNEWGHCWHRHYDGGGYYHPHYWGGYGWHRHWGGYGGWHRRWGYGGGYGWHRHWGGWDGGYGWHPGTSGNLGRKGPWAPFFFGERFGKRPPLAKHNSVRQFCAETGARRAGQYLDKPGRQRSGHHRGGSSC